MQPANEERKVEREGGKGKFFKGLGRKGKAGLEGLGRMILEGVRKLGKRRLADQKEAKNGT